jgi:3-oxoacyl-[acyl-carrier protein] reductase
MRLKGRVALITGAGLGIGRGIACAFATEGASVVIGTRSQGAGEETVAMIRANGGQADLVVVDVASRAGCEQLVADCVGRHGRIDILLHNAAAFPFASVETLTDDDLEATLALNVKSCFWLTKAALPHLRGSASPRILITSSVSGNHATAPGLTHYSASKAAVTGFIRNLALELAAEGITVNAVEPGFIRTERNSVPEMAEIVKNISRQIPMRRAGDVGWAAGAMLFLASNQASYITGQSIVVDGGLTLGVPGDFADITGG